MIHQLQVKRNRIGLAEVFELPPSELAPIEISEDWHKRPLKSPLRFRVCVDQDSLIFAAEIPLGADFLRVQSTSPEPRMGEYVEGLWEADVVELFLFRENSLSYTEFNLGPSAAWWAMGFVNYRERDEGFARPEAVETYRSAALSCWQLALRVPQALFREGVLGEEFPPKYLNITAIIQGRYFSFANHEGGEPDFHRPRKRVNFSV